jgi:hypothetical protein
MREGLITPLPLLYRSKIVENPGTVAFADSCCVLGTGEVINYFLSISPFVAGQEFSEP